MGTLSIWHWLIVLAVVLLVFGTKKLRNLGGDLGGAIKGFKQAMKEGETDAHTDGTTDKPRDTAQLSASEQAEKDKSAQQENSKV